MGKFDDVVAKPLGGGDDDLGRRGRLAVLFLNKLLVALDAGLGFRLAGLWA
jgi:hypothetical protein